MINNNDCFDCKNSRPIFSGEWICDVTQEIIINDGILEKECENFK